MRSSKSRSRSKSGSNRNRQTGGNVINRVFDSSGPEGKVRGTPQQIIDKYNQLARDAHLGNDRVAVENFQQHSEHYTRLLSEAQRQMDEKREQQEREQRDRQQAREAQHQHNRNDRQPQDGREQSDNRNTGGGAQPETDAQPAQQPEQQPDRPAADQQPETSGLPDFIAAAEPAIQTEQPDHTGLVETPENAPRKRRPRARKPQEQSVKDDTPDTPEAAE